MSDRITTLYQEVFGNTEYDLKVTTLYQEVFGNTEPSLQVSTIYQEIFGDTILVGIQHDNLYDLPRLVLLPGGDIEANIVIGNRLHPVTPALIPGHQVEIEFSLSPSLMTLPPLVGRGYMGIDTDLDEALKSIHLRQYRGNFVWDTTLNPSLFVLKSSSNQGSELFSIDGSIHAAAFSLLPGTQLEYDTFLEENLKSIQFPLGTNPIIYETILESTLQELSVFAVPGGSTQIVTPSSTKYLESHRSGIALVLMGVEQGEVFKFNKTAASFRRQGAQQILHLGVVKPHVVTIDALFRLLTPHADLDPFDFYYETPGGYLLIYNDTTIELSLLPADITSDAIDTSEDNVSDVGRFLTTFDVPRTNL